MIRIIKEIIRDIVPPFLWRVLRKLRLRSTLHEWEYIPEGWGYAKAHSEVKGWNVQDVLEIYKQKWPRFVAMTQRTGSLEVAYESSLTSNADISSHNTIMTYAYVIALAAYRLDSLSMLDWGGGIGHYYMLAQALLPGVQIDYHCKEVPILAEYGAKLLPDQHFYADESCLERSYDFVMASTSFHYTENWQGLLASLSRSAQGYLYITGLPTIFRRHLLCLYSVPMLMGTIRNTWDGVSIGKSF